jgi:UDP-glucose 4-epimerase
MTMAWVVGSGGLLGSALSRALRLNGDRVFFPAARFCWGGGPELIPQMATAVQTFASQVDATDHWEIYWAAGVGTMSSPEEVLAPETSALAVLLRTLASNQRLMSTSGAIAFASSAGAIYAGSQDDIITENTSPTPTTAYAREKLRQEALLSSFARTNPRTSALIARISTVYGPGQAAGKQQGLLTHIARRILRNQPIQIFVPYDTIRDYIAADDAAAAMIDALRMTAAQPGVITKIIASGQPATIAEIISIFKRIARRSPLVVTSASRLSGLYSRRVQYRSIAFPASARAQTKSLPIGIAQLMMAERSAFVRSSTDCLE